MIKEIKKSARLKKASSSVKLTYILLILIITLLNSACFFIIQTESLSDILKITLIAFMLVSEIIFSLILRINLKTILNSKRLDFLRLLGFELILLLIRLSAALLFFLPSTAVFLIFGYIVSNDAPFYSSVAFLAFDFILFFTGLVFFRKTNRLLFLSEYIFLSGSSQIESIKKSFAIMENKTSRLSRLNLSFLSRFILCLLVIPIPFIVFYYNKCLFVFAENCLLSDNL